MSLSAGDLAGLAATSGAGLFGAACFVFSIFILVRPEKVRSFYPAGQRGTWLSRVSAIVGLMLGVALVVLAATGIFY
jgi:uncharacterized membrane protein